MGPIWSKEEAKATKPYLETAPKLGFKPTTPQNAAGCLTDPPVSEPTARGAKPAAIAAAEPPEEPPGTLLKSQGLQVIFTAEFSVVEPIPNSSMLVFPIMIAPASFNFSIMVAS